METLPTGPTAADPGTRVAAWAFAPALALKLALHLPFLRGYGIFRDELYYLACAARPALGYADHAPLSVWFLAIWTAGFGDSLLAVRLAALLWGCLAIVGAGLVAREFGGNTRAVVLATIAALAAPQVIGLSHLYSMNIIEVCLWTFAVYALLLRIRTGDLRYWWLVGLTIGLGAMNKHTAVVYAVCLAVGVVLSPLRADLRRAHPYVGVLIALAVFLPNLLWQVGNDFVTLEFASNAAGSKNVRHSVLAFVAAQFIEMNPFAALLWVPGTVWLVRSRQAGTSRLHSSIGWAFVVLFAVALATGAKTYYLVPAFLPMLAAGAVAWTGQNREPGAAATVRRNFAWILSGALLAFAVVSAPMAVPMLSVPDFLRYQQALGLKPTQNERGHTAELPQHYADAIGWKRLGGSVERVWRDLPPDQRARTLVVASNYGQAGAIERFGPRELVVTSGHNSYALWPLPREDFDDLLAVGLSSRVQSELAALYASAESVALHRCAFCVPVESAVSIVLLRGRKVPLAEVRRRLRRIQ